MRICKDFNISERTAGRYLRDLIKKEFLQQSVKDEYGTYSKV